MSGYAIITTSFVVLFVESFFLWQLFTVSEKNRLENKKLLQDLQKERELRQVERKGRISTQQRAKEQISKSLDASGLPYRYKAIGYVESPFPDRRGTPRQPQLVRAARGKIRFDKKIVQHEMFKELESFSHIWVRIDLFCEFLSF